MKTISFIAPCYNEVTILKEYVRRVQSVADAHPDFRFEFVIVNDGSNDGSRTLLDRLADRDVRLKIVHLASNQGHQTALFAGIEAAGGDINITLDIDLQDPPELCSQFIREIAAGYDVVHAQRRRRPDESIFKLLTARFFYSFLKLIANIDLVEDCGDFRAFTGQVRKTVCCFRERHKFLRGLFVLVGFRQQVIVYDRDRRYLGETKYSFVKMLNLAVDGILSFSRFPIRMLFLVSFLMWSTSLGYLAKAMVSHFVYGTTVQGWTSIVFLQTFFTGIVLFCLALLGAYVGRIYEQGQRRPAYWVHYRRNFEDALDAVPGDFLMQADRAPYSHVEAMDLTGQAIGPHSRTASRLGDGRRFGNPVVGEADVA